MTSDFTYITTCKGRLEHIKKTLPRAVSQPGMEVIVVDYDCPDGTQAWIQQHFPQVKTVKISNEPGFHLPKARNAGGMQATTKWLGFFDADILISENFIEQVLPSLKERCFYRFAPLTLQSWGSVICERSAFERTKGYDTNFHGWGVEDDDFYSTLEFFGYNLEKLSSKLLSEIDHTNDLRTRFYSTSKFKSHQINECYRVIKLDLMRINGNHVPAAVLEGLYQQIRSEILKTTEAGLNAVDIKLSFPPTTIHGPDPIDETGRRPMTKVRRGFTYQLNWELLSNAGPEN